jgi:hypothetical protein
MSCRRSGNACNPVTRSACAVSIHVRHERGINAARIGSSNVSTSAAFQDGLSVTADTDDGRELTEGDDFHDVAGLGCFGDVAVADVHADVLWVGWVEGAVAAGDEDEVAGASSMVAVTGVPR